MGCTGHAIDGVAWVLNVEDRRGCLALVVDFIYTRLAAKGDHAALLLIDGFPVARRLYDAKLSLVGARSPAMERWRQRGQQAGR